MTRSLTLAAALLLTAASAAKAQAPGGPIVELPTANPRFGVLGDFSRGELTRATGVVRSWGATALTTLGGSVSLSAGGALLDADSADSGWSVHGAIAPELCGAFRPDAIEPGFNFCDLLPGIVALRLRAGANYASFDIAGRTGRAAEATLGAAFAVQAPIPKLTAELYLAPRLHLLAADEGTSGDDDSAVSLGGGATLGLGVTLTSGLGLHAAIDQLWIDRLPGDDLSSRFAFSLGLHYLR